MLWVLIRSASNEYPQRMFFFFEKYERYQHFSNEKSTLSVAMGLSVYLSPVIQKGANHLALSGHNQDVTNGSFARKCVGHFQPDVRYCLHSHSPFDYHSRQMMNR